MSTDCHYTKSEIADYYFNRLTVEEELEMQEHILTCPQCSAELKKLRALNQAISTDEAAENAPKKGKSLRIYVLWVSSIAAVILIAALIFFVPNEESSFRIEDPDRDSIYMKTDTIQTDSIMVYTPVYTDLVNPIKQII